MSCSSIPRDATTVGESCVHLSPVQYGVRYSCLSHSSESITQFWHLSAPLHRPPETGGGQGTRTDFLDTEAPAHRVQCKGFGRVHVSKQQVNCRSELHAPQILGDPARVI